MSSTADYPSDRSGGVASTEPAQTSRAPRGLWFLRCLLLGAAAIAALLYVRTQDVRALPPGCGPGSPCSTVLASRWAQAAGVSVTVPALGLYLTALLATFAVHCPRCGSRAAAFARAWLALAAGLLLGAAVWFLGVQGLLLGAWCPWCLAEHALGIAAAGTTLWVLVQIRRAQSAAPRWGLSLALAVAALASLIAVQTWGPFEPQAALRFESRVTRDSGPGPDRVLELAGGAVTIRAGEFGWLGSPDAPHLLLALSDYSCDHCRTLHRHLEAALRRYPGQVAVLVVPVPLNPQCNPYVPFLGPEHEHACSLAQLALAVAAEEPTKFPGFDYWLFATEEPRAPAAALAEAARRMPGVDWEAALQAPRVAATLRLACDVYRVSHAQQLPALLGQGLQTIVGAPPRAELLFADLERQLGLQPVLSAGE